MYAEPSDDLTPAERRRARVRAAILEAAERVFAKEGEDGLSIRRLAEEIDYSPGAIYKYFDSKDDLIDELKEAFFARILDKIDENLESGAPFRQRARNCVAAYIRTALEKPQHYAAAFSGVTPAHGTQTDMTCAPSNKMRAFDFLADMIAEGQALGELRAELDPVDAAKSLWTGLHGAAVIMAHLPDFPTYAPRPSSLDREGFLTLHSDLLMRGLET